MVQASDQDASWMGPCGGSLRTSSWDQTLRADPLQAGGILYLTWECLRNFQEVLEKVSGEGTGLTTDPYL